MASKLVGRHRCAGNEHHDVVPGNPYRAPIGRQSILFVFGEPLGYGVHRDGAVGHEPGSAAYGVLYVFPVLSVRVRPVAVVPEHDFVVHPRAYREYALCPLVDPGVGHEDDIAVLGYRDVRSALGDDLSVHYRKPASARVALPPGLKVPSS